MGPRPHLSFCACKTTWLASELLDSMGPSPLLCFNAITTATLWPELIVSMGPTPHLSFCACKTTWLAAESLVSVGSSPHLWFLNEKQRLYGQNYKSPWVPDLNSAFCIQNSDFSTRIVSIYESQPSSVVLCIHNSDIMTRINSLYGCQTSPVVLCMQKKWLASELLISMGPSPPLWFLHPKQRLLDQNYKSLWVADLTYGFLHAKQRD